MLKHALLILANGFEEIEALTSVDLLRRADITVTTAGLLGREVKGSHDIVVTTETALEDYSFTHDAVILPGGLPGANYLSNSEKVLNIIKDSASNGIICAAICAAPIVLDKAGLLLDKNFTCYPSIAEKIKTGRFTQEDVVQDGNIITSRGVGTAIPFSLKIIENLQNRETAEDIASKILYYDKF